MGTKISDLPAIATLALDDVFPVVDVSGNATKKITLTNLINEVLGQGASSIPWTSINKSGSSIDDMDETAIEQRQILGVEAFLEPLSLIDDIYATPIEEDPSGATIDPWPANTVVGLGFYCKPATPDDSVYECVGAGTTDPAEPVFDNTLGKDTTEAGGGVIWRCRGLNVINTRADLRTILRRGDLLYYNAYGATAGYYGQIIEINANRIFIAGASLFTTHDMNYCYYSKHPLIEVIPFYINGTYGDDVETDLLKVDMSQFYSNRLNDLILIGVAYKHETDDTGTEPFINITRGGTPILDNDNSKGVQPSTSWQINVHPTGISTGAYEIITEKDIEIECTVTGGTGDAANLSVLLIVARRIFPAPTS